MLKNIPTANCYNNLTIFLFEICQVKIIFAFER